MAIIIFTNYNCFHSISLPHSLVHEIQIMNFFNTGLIFTPEVVILCKKTMAREGAGDHKFLIYLLIYSNRLAYLELITVLAYRSSLPKNHEQGYLNFSQKL